MLRLLLLLAIAFSLTQCVYEEKELKMNINGKEFSLEMDQEKAEQLVLLPLKCVEKEYPNKSIEFVRSIAEGDLVALHSHQIWEGDAEYITMDFFRFDDNGKIVEHWDSIQQIPETSANGNTMY